MAMAWALVGAFFCWSCLGLVCLSGEERLGGRDQGESWGQGRASQACSIPAARSHCARLGRGASCDLRGTKDLRSGGESLKRTGLLSGRKGTRDSWGRVSWKGPKGRLLFLNPEPSSAPKRCDLWVKSSLWGRDLKSGGAKGRVSGPVAFQATPRTPRPRPQSVRGDAATGA